MKRLWLALVLLLVASCSGGGCSSGCSACGTSPLPGGFPTSGTIANAASVRVTRPGLDFLQANVGALATRALAGSGTTASGGVTKFPIPKSSQSSVTLCSPSAPVSPQCEVEIGVGDAKLRINAVTPNRIKLDGVVPIRMRDLPITLLSIFPAYVVVGDSTKAPGQNLCDAGLRGSPSFPYKEFPLNVELPLVAETRAPRAGYTKVDVAGAVIDIAITQNDIGLCGNTQGLLDIVKSLAFGALVDGLRNQIRSALSDAFCTAPSPGLTPPCPNGSSPDDPDPAKAKRCNFTGSKECVPALLGTDGRLDLGRALSSFSPGTQGGLDFVLASEGNVNPAPGATGVPTWTPRAPPIPAQDNNVNGISLKLLGGARPQPPSKCVEVAPNPPPTGIPLPKELLGDAITPWPANAPGPHLGVAIAGRFLGHALTSAYNSGALCLGLSTEQVPELSSGYLSLIAPSMKNLTFELAPAAAAITTRPGAPPRLKLGGGTDIKTDPLLAVILDRLAIEFYVFSSDRFVRAFTYTADVTAPLNLQTGKDPNKNPNGGLLPILGDLRIDNPAITNTELLFEDAGVLSGAVTGLLSGLLGQLLGGGLSPVDLQSALQSFGLSLDIPAGGIRKLTSGSDDFLAVFANLATLPGAAREEADTRAVLLERFVDPGAMSLATAVRERFPRLRVRVEGIASRPTEHTWWVDHGTHAAWSTSPEIEVGGDAMLLQGRHVLHVASRVVGDAASEDATPAEIPFVLDVLAPSVEAQREDGRVRLRAWDYVSASAALLARHRSSVDGSWSEWTAAADFDDPGGELEVEVKDEEANVAKVTLPLRGRADASLAAGGSGCSCRAAGSGGHPPNESLAASLALAAAFALVGRRSRRGRGDGPRLVARGAISASPPR